MKLQEREGGRDRERKGQGGSGGGRGGGKGREERRGRKERRMQRERVLHITANNSQPGRFQLCFGYLDRLLDTLESQTGMGRLSSGDQVGL